MSEAAVQTGESARAAQHRLSLKPGGMLKVQGGGGDGIRVLALEGRLWIIQESDVRDYELEAGESICIGREGVTLIQAMTASSLALQSQRAPGSAMAGRFSMVGVA